MNNNRLVINKTAAEYIDIIEEICKEKKPLVIICCPTFNHEHYLRDALDGFVMQKTDFPFVAIVHDDASTDKTSTVIQEYAEKYPDIILPILEKENQYSKKDGSINLIMKKAIAVTRAKYIAMCEGDDYWTDPFKLQKQVDFLETHPMYGICFTECLVRENGNNKLLHQTWCKSNVVTFDSLLNNGNQITTLTSLYLANYYKEYENLKKPMWPLGDYPLWLYITQKKPAYKLPDVTSVYRVLGESASHSTDIKKQFYFSLAILEIKIFYAKLQHKSLLKFYFRRCKFILRRIYTNPKYAFSFISYLFKLRYK